MKKTFLFASSALIVASTMIISCKKNEIKGEITNTKTLTTQTARVAPTGLANVMTVSSRGFLVFASDGNALIQYTNFLSGNDAQDIQSFDNSISFTSQIVNGSGFDNYIAPSQDNLEYIFNTSGIVQFGDLIVRGVNSQGYFLVTKAENLNDDSYQKLVNKTFDPSIMYRIPTGDMNVDNLTTFVNTHPVGYDGGTGGTAQYILFGWKHHDIYTMGAYAYTVHSFYIFGVKVYEYTSY